jgi:hypothetical protein
MDDVHPLKEQWYLATEDTSNDNFSIHQTQRVATRHGTIDSSNATSRRRHIYKDASLMRLFDICGCYGKEKKEAHFAFRQVSVPAGLLKKLNKAELNQNT